MDLHTDYDELANLFTESRLQRIGTLAVRAYILARKHEANTVAERQGKVGPGSTQDSHQNWSTAYGHVQAEITDAFGAAQVERDNSILHSAVLAGVTDEHAIRERLGHELTDRDRYELTRLRNEATAPQEFTLTPAPETGVPGGTENAREDDRPWE